MPMEIHQHFFCFPRIYLEAAPLAPVGGGLGEGREARNWSGEMRETQVGTTEGGRGGTHGKVGELMDWGDQVGDGGLANQGDSNESEDGGARGVEVSGVAASPGRNQSNETPRWSWKG